MSNLPVWSGKCTPCTSDGIAHVATCVHPKYGHQNMAAIYNGHPAGPSLPSTAESDLPRRWLNMHSESDLNANESDWTFDAMTGAASGGALSVAGERNEWLEANAAIEIPGQAGAYIVTVPSLTTAWESQDFDSVPFASLEIRGVGDPAPANPPYDKSMPWIGPGGAVQTAYWPSGDESTHTARVDYTLQTENLNADVRAIVDDLVDGIPWDDFPPGENWTGYVFYGPTDPPGDMTPIIVTSPSLHGNSEGDFRETQALALGYTQTSNPPGPSFDSGGDALFPGHPTSIYYELTFGALGTYPLFSKTLAKANYPQEWSARGYKRDSNLPGAMWSPWFGEFIQTSGDHTFISCADTWDTPFDCLRTMRTMLPPDWDTELNLWDVYRFDVECDGTARQLRY